MRYIVMAALIALNVPFALEGSAINIFTLGFIIAITLSMVMDDLDI